MGKGQSSTNGAEKTGHTHVTEQSQSFIQHHVQKSTQKVPKTLRRKQRTKASPQGIWQWFLGRKAVKNLDSILKNRDNLFTDQGPYRQSSGFPVVMHGCERWTIKKAEHQKIDTFELWCWGRLLRVPWTARRSNQSKLKEINTKCSLEGLKLKLQYFGHLMQRTDSLAKTLMLGKIEGRRRRGVKENEMVG